MENVQMQMNHAVQQFVAHVTELARRAALETLESTFRGHMPTMARDTANAAATTKVGARGTRGAKRSQDDLHAMVEKAAAFIKANPGLRIEQINQALGTTTKQLALPMRKLLAEGRVSSKGQRRATMYFPGKKAK